MSLTIIHTADWQIGKPFGAFPTEAAAVLRDARLGAIDRIAEAASARGARHVLVAGDVYDSDQPSLEQLRQPMARLAGYRLIIWHLLPGNHDPTRPGGVWERLRRDGLPPNVLVHDRSATAMIEPDVALLPAPLASRAVTLDPTRWMTDAPTPSGALRIGLAHGSIRGFGGDGEAAVPIAPDRAELSGLAYLALGDWHGVQPISPRAWYSGTPEPDGYRDNSAGHVLAVTFDAPGAPPRVEKIATATYRWLALELSADAVDRALERQIADAGVPLDRVLVRLVMTGNVTLSEAARLRDRLDRLGARLRHLDLDLARLVPRAEAADMSRLTGVLAGVAERLQTIADDAGDPRAVDARGALTRLFDVAGAGEGGGGS